MCITCGCGTSDVKINEESAPYRHSHGYRYTPRVASRQTAGNAPMPDASANASSAAHAANVMPTRRVKVEQDLLAKNNSYAANNRRRLAKQGIFTLNLVSSPGSGKTTLLCKTIALLKGKSVAVIEGDQQTSLDAERIRATGAAAVQINTGKGCHLDAHMVERALDQLELAEGSLLMIENVGNLVCPAAFDLGEACKVVILSVTEGEDKPLKYPDMFRAARLLLLNKCDLLPYVDFNVDTAIAYAQRVNPEIEVIQLSASTGAGMGDWLAWIERGSAALRVSSLIATNLPGAGNSHDIAAADVLV